MNKSNKLLSDIVSFRTYAKYLAHLGRRETLEETINRNMSMHLDRFPKLSKDILKAYKQVHELKVMPSMRSMQFGGEAIVKNNTRIFNCSFVHAKYERVFAEILYLLLCGTGVGFSVQKRHTSQLPTVRQPKEENFYQVHDSIEGWADALDALTNAYFYRGIRPIFDFSKIRAKGSYLVTTGAKAPGPEPLKSMLVQVEARLRNAIGRKLSPLEVHDIICIAADCVLAGGIRRAALISLFDFDDAEMLSCKSGNWWEKYPYRARANNSAVLNRKTVTKAQFRQVFDACIASNAGEPGISWTNDEELGTNPCQPAFATVLTPTGISTMGEIVAGDTIWSGTRWTKVMNKWSTGVKNIYSYNTTTGRFVGTSNHKVFQNGERIEAGEADSIDVCVGPAGVVAELNVQDIMDGVVLGDGSVHKASNHLVHLFVGEKDKDYLESEIAPLLTKYRPGISKYAWEIQTTITAQELPQTYLRSVPDRFFFGDTKKKIGFLRGLFTANGCIAGKRVSLKQVSKKLICQVQDMLSSIGIQSYITTNKPKDVQHKNGLYTSKQSYDLNISVDKSKFYDRIGFIQKYKQQALADLKPSSGARKQVTSDIQSFEHLGEFEVFDISVDCEEHSYWTGGCLVSNCHEISLKSNQFCNLTSTNLTNIKSDKDLNNRVYAASLLGTLQASYTDFPYLSEKWRMVTEQEALLGCSFTGIADSASNLNATQLKDMAKLAVEVNQNYAKKIGINPAARVTTVKPEGSASCVVGSSSGIHARHAEHYLRRVRMNKDDALARYLKTEALELVEDDLFSPSGVVITIGQESPEGAIVRTKETAKTLFNRIMLYYRNWILPGHQSGENTHNVSCTINYKPEEVEELFEMMWDNRENYSGISLLPFDGGSYQQAPFEECSKEVFEKYDALVKNIDLTKVIELEDHTDRVTELACAGGSCDIDFTKPKK